MSIKSNVRILDKIREVSLTRAKAIKLRCLDCSAFLYNGVRECDNTSCSLYELRLTGRACKNKRTDISFLDRIKCIKKYCMHCCCDNSYLVVNCVDKECSLYPFRGYLKENKNDISSDSSS